MQCPPQIIYPLWSAAGLPYPALHLYKEDCSLPTYGFLLTDLLLLPLSALEASQILFGNATSETLRKIDENTFLSVFEGVPQFEIALADLKNGITVVDFLADKTAVMASKGEARRALKSNAVSINKERVSGEDFVINEGHLIDGKYILAQSGKKNYYLVIVK